MSAREPHPCTGAPLGPRPGPCLLLVVAALRATVALPRAMTAPLSAAVLATSLITAPLAAAAPSAPSGRPTVVLDRLDFPESVPARAAHVHYLKRFLGQQARKARWGAGRDNRIEYRFSVVDLKLERDGDVLRVTCTAVGRLPGGRTARSTISYGGAPARRDALVRQVLTVVGRGVVARLAELERQRRGLR